MRLESPSTDKAAVDRCGAALAEMLRAARRRASDRLRAATTRGDHSARRVRRRRGRQVLLLGHFDTVWPVGHAGAHAAAPRRRPAARSRRLRHEGGDRAGDARRDRGAARDRHAAAAASTMLWTTDEEIGSETSRGDDRGRSAAQRARCSCSSRRCRAAALKTARKGCGEFELTVHGVAAHAGLDPGKGASAIHELAAPDRRDRAAAGSAARHQRQRRHRLRRHRGPTSSPRKRARRSTSGRRRARRPTRSRRRCAACNRDRPGTRLDSQGRFRAAADGAHARRRRALHARVAQWPPRWDASCGEGSAGGGSDGNFTAALGVPTLDGLGAVGDGAHARARTRGDVRSPVARRAPRGAARRPLPRSRTERVKSDYAKRLENGAAARAAERRCCSRSDNPRRRERAGHRVRVRRR